MRRLATCMLAAAGLAGLPTASAQPQQTTSQRQPLLQSAGQRFVFGQISDYRRDQFMLDTATGRLWKIVCLESSEKDKSSCAQMALDNVPYLSEGQLRAAPH